MDKKAYEISVNRVLNKRAFELPTWDQFKSDFGQGWDKFKTHMSNNAGAYATAGSAALLAALLGKKKNWLRNFLLGGVAAAGAYKGAEYLGLLGNKENPATGSTTNNQSV